MFFDDYYKAKTNNNDNVEIIENIYNMENGQNEIMLDNDYDNYMIGAYNDYLENKREENIDLINGFYLGNIFTNSYKPYKNLRPKKINAYSDKEKLMLKIYELEFIINDLNLYLDINKNDNKTYEIFKKYAKKLNDLKDEYNKKYQVLEVCKDINGKYTWINNPWSWDGDISV